jgi:hypothetical protein
MAPHDKARGRPGDRRQGREMEMSDTNWFAKSHEILNRRPLEMSDRPVVLGILAKASSVVDLWETAWTHIEAKACFTPAEGADIGRFAEAMAEFRDGNFPGGGPH